jgi:CIC family chloride channel protein
MFIRLSALVARLAHWPVLLRFGLAGLLTAGLGYAFPRPWAWATTPSARVLYGEMAVGMLLLIAGAKILATAVSVGVGMPVGMIGPNLLLGACVGGLRRQPGAAISAGDRPTSRSTPPSAWRRPWARYSRRRWPPAWPSSS